MAQRQRRLDEHGPNAIEEERQSPVLRLLAHFWGPLPWLLEVAIVLAAIAQRWEDLAVALAVWAYALVSLFVLNVSRSWCTAPSATPSVPM